MRVGLISDIHGKLRPEVFELLAGVDRILFAGDVERLELLDELEVIAPLDAVWGNVDGHEIRRWTAESVKVELDGVQFAITHGDLVFPHFDRLFEQFPTADVIVHGHSHVPRCDRRGSRWIVNPGAVTKPRSGHPASVAIAEVKNGVPEVTHFSLADGAPFTP